MTLLTPEQRAQAAGAILSAAPVLPVITLEHAEDALPLARTLVDAGLRVLEVTLRSEAALPAIAEIAQALPQAIVGAGTVLGVRDLEAVVQAGAAFAIAPGATEALYRAAAHAPISLIPGVATASDVMLGMEHGHRVFKFFPAEANGGIAALRALSGPFREARFCPTGGIDAERAPDYLALPNVLTVGGSWMLPADALAARDWARIGGLARAAAAMRAR